MSVGADYSDYSFPLKWKSYFDRTEANLESHQLLWTDQHLGDIEINEEELYGTLTHFRELVHHTRAFDHWNACAEYIRQRNAATFTFLVCSTAHAKQLVSNLSPFTETKVWKLYVYCKREKQKSSDWLEEYNWVSDDCIYAAKKSWI